MRSIVVRTAPGVSAVNQTSEQRHRADATNEVMLAFGNNIINPDGGTHVSGLKNSLTRTINAYARRNDIFKGLGKDLTPSGEDLREGLTSIVSVKLPNPQFNNQTKEKLLNPEVEKFVSAAIAERLTTFSAREVA